MAGGGLEAPGGREEASKRREGGSPLNQARVGQSAIRATEDSLDFRSVEDLTVYRQRKAASDRAPQDASIGIAPGAGFRVTAGPVWEPDFFVTYLGCVAAIEVDGTWHKGRASADHSRDRHLQRSGLAFGERIDVRDVEKPEETPASSPDSSGASGASGAQPRPSWSGGFVRTERRDQDRRNRSRDETRRVALSWRRRRGYRPRVSEYVCQECGMHVPGRRVPSGVGGRLYEAGPAGCMRPACVNNPVGQFLGWAKLAE